MKVDHTSSIFPVMETKEQELFEILEILIDIGKNLNSGGIIDTTQSKVIKTSSSVATDGEAIVHGSTFFYQKGYEKP